MNLKKPLATIWWINAALLGALVMWWLNIARSDWQAPAPLMPDYSAVLDGALLPGQLSAKEYTAIIEFPIFEVDRTWPKAAPKVEEKVPEPVKEEPPKNALSDAVLQGIYDQANSGMAIFTAEGKSHRLKMGETYEEWTMTAITPLSASFSHPTLGEKTLTIKRRFELEKSEKNTETPAASNGRNQRSSLLAPTQARPPTASRPTAAPARSTSAAAPSSPPSGTSPPKPSGGATIGGSVIGGSSAKPAESAQ